ncbi:MAG: HIR complex subunit [Chaenotheca gracillima]|nr:MAG: HIR complex subunit [Chaenotheca gracillima]
MRFIKPSWLTHGGERKDFEVYSCNVSPDGKRLVTAAGDGHLRIWSTEAIYNAANPEYTGPRQLASMNNHSGTIHTVRFSPNNKYLASGADDKIVCVYSLDPGPASRASTFGTNESPPVENWRLFRRLIGHDNDVQDLGWSADSSILVSVGLDSKVVVWSGYTFEKLKTLSNHQSHVKGLTFDPANKYFATASDDRSIKVFRFTPPAPNSSTHDNLNNFLLETTIKDPFNTSPLTTYFRRCSWSPDGNHIAAANAVNGPVSAVAIVNRGTWDSDITLIGHEAPVEVCAFSPKLFSKDPPSEDQANGADGTQPSLVTVIACAGQDKALTIWNTSHARPLTITQDLAAKSISDLAWSPDSKSLFVTSLDGSIIGLVFDDGDLGYAVGFEENERALAKFGAGRKGVGMVEGPDGFLLEDQSKAGELDQAEGRMGKLMGDQPSSASKAQVELNGSAETNGVRATDSTTSGSFKNHLNGNHIGDATQSQAPVVDQQKAAQDQNAAKLERLKQRVTYTKDGKKRIAPLLVSGSAGETQSSLPRAQLVTNATSSNAARSDAPHSTLDLSKPFDGLPQGGLAALLLGNRRKLSAIDSDPDSRAEKRLAATGRNGAVPIMVHNEDGLAPAKTSNLPAESYVTPEFIRPAVINPVLSISQVRLAVPKLRAHIVRSLDASGNNSVVVEGASTTDPSTSQGTVDVVIEARNPTGPAATGRANDRDPARVAVTKKGQLMWQDYLPRNILLVTGNQSFWAAACEEGSVVVWTQAGRRAFNTLVVEAQPVVLECRGWWLLCVTAVGMCYVWNINTRSAPHPPVSLAPILDIAIHSLQPHPTSGPAVTSARLNSQGHIIITLNNGDGYTYSPSMYVWERVSEPWWAVGSQYWNTTDSSVGNIAPSGQGDNVDIEKDGEISRANVSAGIIPHLERNTTAEVLLRGRGYHLQRLVKSLLSREGYEGFETTVSVAHLENRIAAAMELGSKAEFQVYLYMYAKRIGAEGMKGKVDELLRTLVGPLYEEDDHQENATRKANIGDEEDGDLLCGWPRRELVKGVIQILGKHRDLQRITVPYSRVLGLAEDTSGDADAMIS